MEFNPSKCQVVRISNKRNLYLSSYNIRGHVLEVTDSAKYLGVHIDSKLNFNTHVDAVTKKANSTRAFLSRNFSRCTRNIKAASYKTYIRPVVEYASIAWAPHAQRNIKKVEQVQRSSARYVTGNYDRTSSVTSMLDDLQWSPLDTRRHHSRLSMLYKIRFDHVDVDWKLYLRETNTRTRGHSFRFWVPRCKTNAYSSSFFVQTCRDWNVLKMDPASFPSPDAFKSALGVTTK
jgi:hypothetical protein